MCVCCRLSKALEDVRLFAVSSFASPHPTRRRREAAHTIRALLCAGSWVWARRKSYYVNYETKQLPLKTLLQDCYLDDECVSFDYDASPDDVRGEGWLHRIPAVCARSQGARCVHAHLCQPNAGGTFAHAQ